MSDLVIGLETTPLLAEIPAVRGRRRSLGTWLALSFEVVRGGFVELWAHKLRSILTLTLLMLGVFTLVVMTSVLDGVMDKVATGFAGLSWDGTAMIVPQEPKTNEDQKRFAMSPGLRYEDLARLTTAHPKVVAFLPRAAKRTSVRIAGGTERVFVTGVTPDYAMFMNRPINLGRGLTANDEKRRSTVAVVGATLASKLFGGADPVGRDVVLEGVPFRIVGVTAPLMIFSEEHYYDSNGLLIPLETYMARIDSSHKLTQVAVKLRSKKDLEDVTGVVLSRIQFLLEALVLAALGALLGTIGGAVLCQKLSHFFPWGLVVNPIGLVVAWAVALGLSFVFGLYPALRAAKLSPMEAMR